MTRFSSLVAIAAVATVTSDALVPGADAARLALSQRRSLLQSGPGNFNVNSAKEAALGDETALVEAFTILGGNPATIRAAIPDDLDLLPEDSEDVGSKNRILFFTKNRIGIEFFPIDNPEELLKSALEALGAQG